MEKTLHPTICSKLATLRSGDPNTALHRMTPEEILDRYGPPRSLLSSSTKAEKCLHVDVLARVLFFAPGVFCSHATAGCLAACLGHSSGRMQMPTHALARDRRTALYLQAQSFFLQMLDVELGMLEHDARRTGLCPAVRLNGTSDLTWEDLHPDLFRRFPTIRFFDYTKVPDRMERFLQRRDWPDNYHLTFSAQPGYEHYARRFLELGGTVAVVFWPVKPRSFWGYPVVDGDGHDARFLDPAGSIVALTAKGMARQDRSGFTVRLCPQCHGTLQEPSTSTAIHGSKSAVLSKCIRCGFTCRDRRQTTQAVGGRALAA